MSQHATIRWIRGLIPLCIILVLVACSAFIGYLSLIGLPDSALRWIENSCARAGVELRIENIKLGFGPRISLVAENVTYSRNGHPLATASSVKSELLFSELPQLVEHVDLLWERLLWNHLEVNELNACIPVDLISSGDSTAVADQRSIRLEHLSGRLFLDQGTQIEIPEINAELQGMKVRLNGRIAQPEGGVVGLFMREEDDDEKEGGVSRAVLDTVLDEFEKVRWNPQTPPIWQVSLSDERNAGGPLRASVRMDCEEMQYKNLQLKKVDLSLGYSGGMLLIKKLSCNGGQELGQLQLTGRLDLTQRMANVSVDSSIPFLKWYAEATGSEYPLPYQIKLDSTPFLNMGAELAFNEAWNDLTNIKVIGNASVGQFKIDNESFTRVSTDFSYNNGDFLISNFSLLQGESSLSGRAMKANNHLKLDLSSSLKAETLFALVKEFANYRVEMPDQIALQGQPYVRIVGDLSFPDGQWTSTPKIEGASISLKLNDFQLYDVNLDSLDLEAEVNEEKVVINQCVVLDAEGHQLSAKGQGFGKEIYFAVSSSLPPTVLERMVKSLVDIPSQLTLPESAIFNATGYLNRKDDRFYGIRLLHVTAEARDFAWNKEAFDSLSTEFQFESGKLLVQNFVLTQPNGHRLELFAKGDWDGELYLSGHNTIDLHSWDRLLQLEDDDFFMERFALNAQSELDLNFHGLLSPEDPANHHDVEASVVAKNIVYKKVAIQQAQAKAHIVPSSVTLSDCHIIYDNTDFLAEQKVRGGPARSTLTAESVKFVFSNDTVEVKGIDGTVYPNYTMKMFSDGASRVLSAFKFTRPVSLTGGGVFPIEDDFSLMKGKIRFRAGQGQVEYPLLGTTLKMTKTSGTVVIDPEWVHVYDMVGDIWGGNFSAKIDGQIDRGDAINGAVTATALNLAQIGLSYDTELPVARVDGTISFRSKNGSTNTIKGNGEAFLSQGNLVDIPLFGKLGQVLSLIPGVGQFINFNLNKAQCSYVIESGFLQSNNFVAKGSNMSLEGGGWIRLDDLQVNSDLRLGLRGIPGLLTSPIFLTLGRWIRVKGVGPLENVKWSYSPFSNTPEVPTSEKATN